MKHISLYYIYTIYEDYYHLRLVDENMKWLKVH